MRSQEVVFKGTNNNRQEEDVHLTNIEIEKPGNFFLETNIKNKKPLTISIGENKYQNVSPSICRA